MNDRMYSFEQDWQFCQNSLHTVSRTFSKPIGALEGDLRTAVTCGYLMCRIADTIEDHPDFRSQLRSSLYTQFLHLLDEKTDAEAFASVFPKNPKDDPEVVLARNAPRVWRVLESLPEKMQNIIRQWVSELTRGMMIYSNRSPVHPEDIISLLTLGDLDRYCYFVAGTIGHMLTDLFLYRSGGIDPRRETAMRTHAESFGMGLQLVNILKDITEDRQRGVSYIPESLCRENDICNYELLAIGKRQQAHAVVAPIMERAHGYLDQALEYTLAIPEEDEDVRLFCLLPLWMAVKTLVLVNHNDGLFDVKKELKISRDDVAEVIQQCGRLVKDSEGLRQAYQAMWGDISPARMTS